MAARTRSVPGRPGFHGLLIQALRRHLQQVRGRMGRPADARQIHNLRTGIKRLRASWRMLRPVLPPARFRRENHLLRTAARNLSALREADVLAKTLEKITAGDAAPLARLLKRSSPGRAEEAVAGGWSILSESFLRFGNLEWNGDEGVLPGLLKLSYRKARTAGGHPGAEGGDGFHAWRKRVKDHWYQLEALQPKLGKRAEKMSRRLDKLQECLGEEHDMATLEVYLERHPGIAGERGYRLRLWKILGREQRRLRRKCLKRGRECFSRKPGRYLDWLGRDRMA